MNQENVLIQPNGIPQYGIFKYPISDLNLDQFSYCTPFGKNKTSLSKYFHFKQFQFISVTHPDFVLGIAIANIKYLSTAFAFLYDNKSQTFHEVSLKQPFNFGTHMDTTPDTGFCQFKKGKQQIAFHAAPGQKHVQAELGNQISINLTLTDPAGYQPLRICTPTGATGWTYTQKSNGLFTTGTIQWKNKTYPLDNIPYGNVDWSAGYMRRETNWNWASFSGQTENGTQVGLNLAAGVNETGHTENCLWIDHELIHLTSTVFRFKRNNETDEWHIKTLDGIIDLVFQPAGAKKENIQLWFIASKFTQLYGKFSGNIYPPGKPPIVINMITGMVEDHYAKW